MSINLNDFSIINGKKYKKCKEGKIRNPFTKRCIKNKNIILNTAAIKIQKFFKPIINRVTGNIEDRIRYYLLIKKFLNINKENNRKCLKLYKIVNNCPIYRIGNKIILKKQIGSSSAHGMVYLTTFRDKKIYKYACKITIATNKAILENKIQQQLTKAIVNCPHFPLLYGTYYCNHIIDTNDSFKNSRSISLPIEQNIKLYPKVVQNAIILNKDLLITFNELANGDLTDFLLNNINFNPNEVFNSLVQIYFSLMFYYQEIKMLHYDAHGGNFLYHKIKKGDYFHYNIYGKDYYLENLGYLWIIWDFEQSISFDKNDSKIKFDFNYVLNEYLPNSKKKASDYTGFNYYMYYINNNEIYEKMQMFVKDFKHIDVYKNKKKFPRLINKILNIFIKYNMILDILPKNAKIINKIPYSIKKI